MPTVPAKLKTVTDVINLPESNFQLGDVLHGYNDAVKTAAAEVTTYTLMKEMKVTSKKTIVGLRVSFDLRMLSSSGANFAYAKLYKNGVAIGTERTSNGDSAVWTTFTEDFTNFQTGDLLQIYLKETAGGQRGELRNMRVYFVESYFENTLA